MKAQQKKSEPVKVKIHQNTDKTVEEIQALEMIGLFRNNWQRRQIQLYADPASAEFVYAVGISYDDTMIITSHDRLSECMNFRIAIDYWAHGKKVYTRD